MRDHTERFEDRTNEKRSEKSLRHRTHRRDKIPFCVVLNNTANGFMLRIVHKDNISL